MLDPNGALVAYVLAELRTNPVIARRWRVLIVSYRRENARLVLVTVFLIAKSKISEGFQSFLYPKPHEDITPSKVLFHEWNFPFFLPFLKRSAHI